MFRNLTLRDILPTGLSYINGSTMIYNAKHPQGVTLSDNIITDMEQCFSMAEAKEKQLAGFMGAGEAV